METDAHTFTICRPFMGHDDRHGPVPRRRRARAVQLLLVRARGLLVTYYVSLVFGIGLSYHRLLTHRSYVTSKALEYTFTVCATLALEGGPLFWVATHRRHHQHSDADLDPHTPRHGRFWAHIGWILFGDHDRHDRRLIARYAPDLARDPVHVWIDRYHWVPLTLLGLVLLAIGGWTWVLWGVFLRTTLGLHATWLVNSATHLWGSRRFETRDDSRNNWWVALVTFGEGLAQQPSRASDVGGARPGLVRNRHQLPAYPRPRAPRAGEAGPAGRSSCLENAALTCGTPGCRLSRHTFWSAILIP